MTSRKRTGRLAPRAARSVAFVTGVLLVAACSSSGTSGPTSAPPATSVGGAGPTSGPGATTGSTSAGTGSASTASPPASGTTAGMPIGVIWDYTKQDDFRPYLERLRGGATWYELEWCQVQPEQNGPIDWSRADKNVARAASVGIETLLRVRVGSCWATGGQRFDPGRGGLGYSVSAPPTDLAAYEAFLRAVVERYRPQGVHEYAIENEVNGEGFWRGSASDYEALVRAGAGAIRAADPKARVLDAGLSSTAWGVAMAASLLDQGKDDEAVRAY